jgi:hypothetical protein
MKVPYAKKWQKETDKLRKIVLDCDLTEELKWGKPCFTYQKKNVAIVIPLKDACALSFFKGALLKDPKHILQNIGEHTQAGRWIKFTSLKEISALQPTLRNYIYEAVRVEDSGKKVLLKKASEYVVPEECASQAERGSRAEGGVRSSSAGTEEVVHLSCLGREAGEDAGSAGGEVCANDLNRPGVQRAPLNPLSDSQQYIRHRGGTFRCPIRPARSVSARSDRTDSLACSSSGATPCRVNYRLHRCGSGKLDSRHFDSSGHDSAW